MNTHLARVAGDVALDPLAPPVLERVRRALSFPNPTYQRAVRLGFHPGAEPEYIEALVEEPSGVVRVPRGAVGVVAEVLAKRADAKLSFVDARARGDVFAGTTPVPCRDYQEEAVAALVKRLQGLVVLPCGTGKTRLGIAAVHAVARTTLVLVPTIDLAEQWAASALDLLGVRAHILGGGFQRDGWTTAPLVVAVVDTLVVELERDATCCARFGLVIVDEAHHAPAITYQRVLGLIPARWRLGLTATPDREDGLTRWVTWSFGPTLLERTTAEMIHLGYLMAAEIEEVETGFRWNGDDLPERKRMAALEEELAGDLVRNLMIADRAAEEARAGEAVLVLAGRRDWCAELAEMIGARGVEAVSLTGKTGKKKRNAALEDLRSGKLPVVVATSLADEGVDVARLSRVLLAAPQRAKGRTAQRLGRLLRDFPGKKPKLVDFIDSLVPTLERRARERRRVWRDAGLIDSRKKRKA